MSSRGNKTCPVVHDRNVECLKEIIMSQMLWKFRGEITFSRWMKQDSLKIVIN